MASQALSVSPYIKTKEEHTKAFPLLDLPVELFHMVRDQLPPCSVEALAATSHEVSVILGDSHRPMDKKSAQDFIGLLEKDVPAHVFLCHRCIKYHEVSPYGPIEGGAADDAQHQPGDLIHDRAMDLCMKAERPFRSPLFYETLGLYVKIPFHEARLIMNGHLYKKPHAMPISRLSTTVFENHYPPESEYPMMIRYSRTAKIVADEILLWCRMEIRQREFISNSQMFHLNMMTDDNLAICTHYRIDEGLPSSSRLLPSNQPPEVPLRGRKREVCPKCYTDQQLSIYYGGKQEGWRVVVESWTNIGSCRSPLSHKWAACNPKSRDLERIEGTYEHGAVREAFEKSV